MTVRVVCPIPDRGARVDHGAVGGPGGPPVRTRRGDPTDTNPTNSEWSTVTRLRWPSWMPVDPYIVLLLGTVGLAALFPAHGTGADVASGASTAAIAFLFFLYGARLSTREALDGLRHWRLHVTVLACTFVVFPVLGLATRGLVPVLLTQPLYQGLLFLTLVPSTIQSSIAFTSIARGNVPAAICAGSFSSLVGIVVTPLLAAAVLGSSAGGFSADSLVEIVLQLLVPFVAGQVLRPWIG